MEFIWFRFFCALQGAKFATCTFLGLLLWLFAREVPYAFVTFLNAAFGGPSLLFCNLHYRYGVMHFHQKHWCLCLSENVPPETVNVALYVSCVTYIHINKKLFFFVFCRWLIFKSEYAKKRHIIYKKRLLESPINMALTNITNFGVEKQHFKTVVPCTPGVLCP